MLVNFLSYKIYIWRFKIVTYTLHFNDTNKLVTSISSF